MSPPYVKIQIYTRIGVVMLQIIIIFAKNTGQQTDTYRVTRSTFTFLLILVVTVSASPQATEAISRAIRSQDYSETVQQLRTDTGLGLFPAADVGSVLLSYSGAMKIYERDLLLTILLRTSTPVERNDLVERLFPFVHTISDWQTLGELLVASDSIQNENRIELARIVIDRYGNELAAGREPLATTAVITGLRLLTDAAEGADFEIVWALARLSRRELIVQNSMKALQLIRSVTDLAEPQS
jgi:hypothetical protein